MEFIIWLNIAMACTFTFLVFKNHRFIKLKEFIKKIFWIDKISHERNKHKFAYKALKFMANAFMIGYIGFSSCMIFVMLTTLNFEMFFSVIIFIIVYPIMYRIVMGVQIFFHGIK